MTTYIGSNGTRYVAGEHLKEGGEGHIYAISDNPEMVLKIYKTIKPEQERKLRAMAACKLSNYTDITWPMDVVTDESGRFAGYVMTRIHGGDPINVIYEYGPRAKYPDLPWRIRLYMAMNLCLVLQTIHRAGQVVGDFNPMNMFVSIRTGHVRFVDTDSYHIRDAGGNTYRCSVGMTNYLAPEILSKIGNGVTLENAPLPTFTVDTDNFALAVHIFQLLMNGAHPFQSAVKPDAPDDVDPPSIREAIMKGYAPHFRAASRSLTYPLYSPAPFAIPPRMTELFKRAFLAGVINPAARPRPEEWFSALDEMRSSVVPCYRNTRHSYMSGLRECPLCEADRRFAAATGMGAPVPHTNPPIHTVTPRRIILSFNPLSDDPAYVHPEWSDAQAVAEVIKSMAPIEGRYLESLVRKILGLGSTEPNRQRIRTVMSGFRHITDGDYTTYLRDTDDYNHYPCYRVSPPGSANRSIDNICLLEMRNALLEAVKPMKEEFTRHEAILKAERKMGFKRNGKKLEDRFSDAFSTLVRDGHVKWVGNQSYRTVSP